MSASAPNPRRAIWGKGLQLLLPLMLSACVSHVPPLQNGNIGVIAGKETAGLDEKAATPQVLVVAARQTVDHGYRYFTLLPGLPGPPGAKAGGPAPANILHAGQNVRFQILRRARAGRGVWDAYQVLARGG